MNPDDDIIWLPRPGDHLALLTHCGQPIGMWVVKDVPAVAGTDRNPRITVTIVPASTATTHSLPILETSTGGTP